jgi:hypothetical protein
LYRNGEIKGFTSILAASQYDANTKIIISGRQSNPASDNFNGDLAEIIHYNRLLTEKEHQSILCFLNEKYAIALTDVSCVVI